MTARANTRVSVSGADRSSAAVQGRAELRAELRAKRRQLDLRTLAVTAAIYGGFSLLMLCFHSMPLALAVVLGSVLLAWHGSLQHETIHGHPTSSRRINAMIGGVPLSLWIPYEVYRETHIRHHRHARRRLTEVGHDPESFYLPPGYLGGVGPIRRAILAANCTLAGRMILGPAIAISRFWASEARKVRSDRRHLLIWCRHAVAVAVVLWWVVGVCQVPFTVYALLIVYPSVSLTLLRSFAEHRADDHSHLRTNVVEANPLLRLLFLNNNLHVAHHARPDMPWHELPRAWGKMRHSALTAGLVFQGGYFEVMRKYLFRPFITPEHPAVAVSQPAWRGNPEPTRP